MSTAPRIIEGKAARIRAEVAAHFAIVDHCERYDHLIRLSRRARAVVDILTCTAGDAREYIGRVHDDDLDWLALHSAVQSSAVKRKLVAARLRRVTENSRREHQRKERAA